MSDKQAKKIQNVGFVITTLVFTCKNCNYGFYKIISGLVYRKSLKLMVSQKGSPDKELGRVSCKKCGSGKVHLFKCI